VKRAQTPAKLPGFKAATHLAQQLITRWRYIKFGLVGASGTVVNVLALYLAQEFLLFGMAAPQDRLYASLALAIVLATLNNFYWNRRWTWRDRQSEWRGNWGTQFGRYLLASWLGTSVQYIMTLWLAQHMHYLIGNVAAIVLASVLNYFTNDWWTFKGQPQAVGVLEKRARYQKISLALLFLGAAIYVFDLGAENIPRNGDELVYAHIALQTWWQAQATGGWLPLASELVNMRNTKPPMLFWQAMLSSQIGSWLGLDWSLWLLRLPSLLYTLANTTLVVLAARALAKAKANKASDAFPSVFSPVTLGYFAGLIYLACFSTYRYGRPYLTSAAETFWMCLPFFALLAIALRSSAAEGFAAANTMPPNKRLAIEPPGLLFFVCSGLCFGVAALYKSFVLLAPLGLALWLALCWFLPKTWFANGLRVALSIFLGLGLFALWFAFDPDPASIWREFVVGENWGKVASNDIDTANTAGGYWRTALVGGSSVWVQALGLVQNALLLGPLVLALMVLGLKKAHQAGVARIRFSQNTPPPPPIDLAADAVLWLYIAAVSLFFMLPSQRSARYLIALMPAVAVLCALYVWRLPLWAQRLALGCSALLSLATLALLAVFLWAGWRIDLYPLWGRLGLLLVLALQGLALARLLLAVIKPPNASLHGAWLWLLGLVLSLFAWFGLLSAPLHGADNQYNPLSQGKIQAAHALKAAEGRATDVLSLATPSNFNADFERWRFLLPKIQRIAPYPDSTPVTPSQIELWLTKHDAVVVYRHWHEAAPDCRAAKCQIIGQRIGLRSRHRSDEINLISLRTPEQIFFWREYLLIRAAD
jgi:putative flippase GtrA